MKVYVVTDGDYSEYAIKGVFNCPDKAEDFRNHHNYEAVEAWALNPETPERVNNLWIYRVNIGSDVVHCERSSNESTAHHWKDFGNNMVLCRFWARDEKQALKIGQDRYRAFKAGSTLLTIKEVKYRGSIIDGRPTNMATHRVEYIVVKQMIGGNLVEVSRVEGEVNKIHPGMITISRGE